MLSMWDPLSGGPVCLLALRVALEVGDGESRPPHSRGNWREERVNIGRRRGGVGARGGEFGSFGWPRLALPWVGLALLFLGAVEPVDEFSHFLV